MTKPFHKPHKLPDNIKLTSVYDSHVHWLMTGEKNSYVNLKKFECLSDIKLADISETSFRDKWLFGFGWSDEQFKTESKKTELDLIATEFPICFIKRDAHSCVLNSSALDIFLKSFSTQEDLMRLLETGISGEFTGVLKETAYYAIYSLIPQLDKNLIREYLLKGQNYFLEQGVTHIRDMTCSEIQWECLQELLFEKKIKIYSEINFHIDNYQHLVNKVLSLALMAKEKSAENPLVKVLGIKLFYDGSLGSETALLSKPYLGAKTSGQQLWTNQDCKEAIKLAWSHGLQISIHTLGDQAVANVVEICRQLQREKINGILNLEHVQLIKPETIQSMKGLHVRCHMQPTHWLSDKLWLKDKLEPEIYPQLFSWEALRKAKIPVFFGSDSPIEEVSLIRIIEALNDSSENGVPGLQVKTSDLFSHPTQKNGETLISKGQIIKAELLN